MSTSRPIARRNRKSLSSSLFPRVPVMMVAAQSSSAEAPRRTFLVPPGVNSQDQVSPHPPRRGQTDQDRSATHRLRQGRSGWLRCRHDRTDLCRPPSELPRRHLVVEDADPPRYLLDLELTEERLTRDEAAGTVQDQ